MMEQGLALQALTPSKEERALNLHGTLKIHQIVYIQCEEIVIPFRCANTMY